MSRAFLIACFSLAALAGAQALTPDAALSARFLPPRYRLADEAASARLEAWFRDKPADSALEFRRGRTVQLTPGAMRLLAREDALRKAGGAEDDCARIRRRLREIAGPLAEDSAHAAQGYLPNDLSLQSTPLWPLHNDGTVIARHLDDGTPVPGIPGVDIGMDRVWERFDGGDSLVIAVIDAGINFLHPDLKDRWYRNLAEANGLPGVDDDANGFIDDSTGWDFVDGDNRPQDYHSHGTLISGQIAAAFDNGIGIAGMLPRARILPIRVLGTPGNGYSGDIADGLRYAAAMGATAVNFSIGIQDVVPDTVIRNGFIALRDAGIPVAAATGNDKRDLDAQPRSPSSLGYANVYNVAAHDATGALAVFSNYGANSADLAAPGTAIATTTIPDAVEFRREDFEDQAAQRWTLGSGFSIGNDTLEGTKSLRWASGLGATATIDSLDLRGRGGGQVSFLVDFVQARERARPTRTVEDWVVIEACAQGQPCDSNNALDWALVALITSGVSKKTLAFGLGAMDGRLFRLRFRTDFLAGGDNATRRFRIDDVRLKHGDETPGNQAKYTVTAGTSMAAPYVAGYAALMRLASARMNVPFTRERMLAGVAPTPALAGKVNTGGRLDVARGLDFYLRAQPALVVTDSARVAWNPGEQIRYALSVVDTAGQPLPGFALSSMDSIGGVLNGAQYTATAASGSYYTVRFRADQGARTLRKSVRFRVGVVAAPVAGVPVRAPLLRVGNRAFVLPAAAARGGGGVLRVEFFAADGRAVKSYEGELRLPAGGAEYRIEGFPAPGLRAWLDGAPLRPARGR